MEPEGPEELRLVYAREDAAAVLLVDLFALVLAFVLLRADRLVASLRSG